MTNQPRLVARLLAVLRSANNLSTDTIKVGQTLSIPATAMAAQP
mgnify:CR=1 FL=1